MSVEYEIKGEWVTDGWTHVYSCRAISKQGRTIGKVTVDVDVDVMVDMSQFILDEPRESIEQSAADTLKSIVEARYGP